MHPEGILRRLFGDEGFGLEWGSQLEASRWRPEWLDDAGEGGARGELDALEQAQAWKVIVERQPRFLYEPTKILQEIEL